MYCQLCSCRYLEVVADVADVAVVIDVDAVVAIIDVAVAVAVVAIIDAYRCRPGSNVIGGISSVLVSALLG